MLPEKINRQEREGQIGQTGRIVWFTGLPGSGKTTVSRELELRLFRRGFLSYLLDGDVVRSGLNSDLGFSDRDRNENIRRIGEVSKLFVNAGFIILVAFISPFRKDRDKIRRSLEPGQFVEVYVDCPLEVCAERDPKGLYQKAREGKIPNFTGLGSSYEPPLNPEVHLQTSRFPLDQCVNQILDFLKNDPGFLVKFQNGQPD